MNRLRRAVTRVLADPRAAVTGPRMMRVALALDGGALGACLLDFAVTGRAHSLAPLPGIAVVAVSALAYLHMHRGQS